MIDKMIVSVMAGVIAIVLAMQILLCSLPLFRRLEYEAVCHRYTMLMDRYGGLSADLAARLAQDLNEHGFAVTRINGTDDADFGQTLDLLIMANFPFYQFQNNLALEEVSVSLTYQSSTLCRRLKSYDAVP